MRTLPITVAADADYPLPGLLTLPDGAGPKKSCCTFPATLPDFITFVTMRSSSEW